MKSELVVAPPEAPLVLFDGDCALCRAIVDRWRTASGATVTYTAYQEAADDLRATLPCGKPFISSTPRAA